MQLHEDSLALVSCVHQAAARRKAAWQTNDAETDMEWGRTWSAGRMARAFRIWGTYSLTSSRHSAGSTPLAPMACMPQHDKSVHMPWILL